MSDPISLIKDKLTVLRTEQENCESEISSLLQEKAAIQQVNLDFYYLIFLTYIDIHKVFNFNQ